MSPYIRRELTPQERAKSFATHPRKMMSRSGGPCCDSCGADDPTYMYAAERMITGEYTRCWRWAMCRTCTDLIEAGRWDELAERTRQAVRAMGNYGAARDEAERLHWIVEKLWESFRTDVSHAEGEQHGTHGT